MSRSLAKVNSKNDLNVVMPCTHGKNREEAIRKGEEVIEIYLEAWQAESESIPEPIVLQIA